MAFARFGERRLKVDAKCSIIWDAASTLCHRLARSLRLLRDNRYVSLDGLQSAHFLVCFVPWKLNNFPL